MTMRVSPQPQWNATSTGKGDESLTRVKGRAGSPVPAAACTGCAPYHPRLTEHVRLEAADTFLQANQGWTRRKNKLPAGGVMVMLLVPLLALME